MIALLVGAAWAEDGVVGLEVGAIAAQGSASADIDGELGVWAGYAPRPWGVAVDLAGWHHTSGARPYTRSSLYRLAEVQARATVLVEVALGTHATTFHAGLGPAIGWTRSRLQFGARDVATTVLDPGIGGRVALDGPIRGALGWEWRVGVTSRGLIGVDYDTALGVGVRW